MDKAVMQVKDHDVDADDSSTGSNTMNVLESIQDRRNKNLKRHAVFLSALSKKYHMHHAGDNYAGEDESMREEDESMREEDQIDGKASQSPKADGHNSTYSRVAPKESFKAAIKTIEKRYPHRASQIRQLASHLCSPIAAHQRRKEVTDTLTSQESTFIPPPIFVVGPSGTGKTSIVKDTMRALRASYHPIAGQLDPSAHTTPVSIAYVNCATLEPISTDRLIALTFNQLAAQYHPDNIPAYPPWNESQHSAQGNLGSHRSAKRRRLSAGKETKSSASSTHDDENVSSPQQLLTSEYPTAATAHSTDEIASGKGITARFGRALVPYFRHHGCGYIILDHAERLLTLSANQRSNAIAEMLLIPGEFAVNLTIIALTSSSVLDHSRLNNLASTEKSGTTLTSGVQPLTIQFPAYTGAITFKDILNVGAISNRLFGLQQGKSAVSQQKKQLMEACISILVQGLLGVTRNIRDFIGLGRQMWPIYIEPLRRKLALSSKSASGWKLDAEARAMLDRRMLNFLQKVIARDFSPRSQMIQSPSKDNLRPSTVEAGGNLSDFILLAAFICQNNRPEKDKNVFVQSNQTRRKKEKDTTDKFDPAGDMEAKQAKMLRPRPFSVERMLSVFASLVGLDPKANGGRDADQRNMFLDSLGSVALYRNLTKLRDQGSLQEAHPTTDKRVQMNLVNPKYWCLLSRREANSLAQQRGITLADYLF